MRVAGVFNINGSTVLTVTGNEVHPEMRCNRVSIDGRMFPVEKYEVVSSIQGIYQLIIGIRGNISIPVLRQVNIS